MFTEFNNVKLPKHLTDDKSEKSTLQQFFASITGCFLGNGGKK
jgi:hypothetical protein